MRTYWQPTATSYFGRVSKERIVQAVRDGVSEQEAQNIVRLKKPAMAEAAEAALAGKGWLPALLKRSIEAAIDLIQPEIVIREDKICMSG
jgi:ParB family chromosome partitioning protein